MGNSNSSNTSSIEHDARSQSQQSHEIKSKHFENLKTQGSKDNHCDSNKIHDQRHFEDYDCQDQEEGQSPHHRSPQHHEDDNNLLVQVVYSADLPKGAIGNITSSITTGSSNKKSKKDKTKRSSSSRSTSALLGKLSITSSTSHHHRPSHTTAVTVATTNTGFSRSLSDTYLSDSEEEQWQNAWDDDDSGSFSDEGDASTIASSYSLFSSMNSSTGRFSSATSCKKGIGSVLKQVDSVSSDTDDKSISATSTPSIHPQDKQQTDKIGSCKKPNESMFSSLRVLGKGSFGKVLLTQKNCGLDKGNLFAMKVLKKTHLQKRGQIERTKTERKVLSLVNHPFIMKLHFAFQTDDKLFLVLDYCAGGELFFHLSRHRRFSEKYTRFYAAELLLALGHLHSHGIIYRDLKPENVLFDADGHVKLGDFGLAKDNIRHPFKGAISRVGTPEYMAPEILQQCGHGFCVDYWGLGMLVYEMLTGLPPWYTTDRETLFKRLLCEKLTIPDTFSPPASSFISHLLQRDPRRRLGVGGVDSVMIHPFFKKINFTSLISGEITPPIRPCEGWKASTKGLSQKVESYQSLEDNDSSGNGLEPLFQPEDIDLATSNFEVHFTRMAIESEVDQEKQFNTQSSIGDDEDGYLELNQSTFTGFSYDGGVMF